MGEVLASVELWRFFNLIIDGLKLEGRELRKNKALKR